MVSVFFVEVYRLCSRIDPNLNILSLSCSARVYSVFFHNSARSFFISCSFVRLVGRSVLRSFGPSVLRSFGPSPAHSNFDLFVRSLVCA